MLLRQKYRRLFPSLALAFAATRQSFVFASAFPPGSASSCLLASSFSSTAKTMLSNDAVEENIVPLSFLETSVNNGKVEQSESLPTLLIHGLDSSSQTWRGLLGDLGATGFEAMAVDQRGCGKSLLGDPELFSPDALVDDLYAFMSSHPMFQSGRNNALIKPFVLVGHSMGGRVAMSFAAKHPELIAALVIEDMDVQTRSLSISSVRSKDRDATVAFDRRLTGISTPKEIVEAFVREGYEASRVEKWLSEDSPVRSSCKIES
mmetsp:Transcript_18266/g.27671  ORF Transcript_18266/g.27671 Transcript_18266/m.27671 type:complete len:262 (+) Transcript_18266:216-1001(+)